jgi:hypothetical protein
MQKFIYPLRVLLAQLIISFGAFLTPAQALTIIGEGPDVSYALIEADEFGDDPLVYQYRYDFDSSAPLDSYALFTGIDSAVPELNLGFINFGDEVSPNYFLNSITYGTTTLTNTPFPLIGPFWAQWVRGGQAGFLDLVPVPSSEWQFGSGISYPYRVIEPDSWDGFVFSQESRPPSIAPPIDANPGPEPNPPLGNVPPVDVNPVPERGSSLLLLVGGTVALWLFRRGHEEKRI